jgi:hypothetical protein
MKNSFINKIPVLLAFMSALAVARAGTFTNSASSNLQIKAEIRIQAKTNIVLEMVVRNIGSKDILFSKGYLPWDRYAMTLILVCTDPASTPLKQQLVISDPMPGEPWRLKAGDTLKGGIDLTDRFPQLLEILKQSEVIVFWSYQLEAGGGMHYERMAGWEIIPNSSSL